MADFVAIDNEGRVVSIQRFEIDAPDFRPQPGDAERWMLAYWPLVSIVTLGLMKIRVHSEGLTLELRGLGWPMFEFGKPWLLETDRFVCWELPLRGGWFMGGKGGYFACAAERRDERRWYFTMVLRGFIPRIAGFQPVIIWKPLYRFTEGILHHLLGIVYLSRRGRSMLSTVSESVRQSS